MKTVYIKEEQKKMIENAITEKDGVRKTLLNEENSTDRKKVEKIISEFCYGGIVPYLLRPVTECEPVRNQVGHTGTYQKVAANEHGFNRLIDYLRINLYEQFGMTRDNGPAKYRIGIARVACEDLGFYSFGQNIQGGKLIKFGRLMKLFAYKPELMFDDGVGPDKNLNGMTYDELMDKYGPKMDAYVGRQKSELDRDAANGLRHGALRDESPREINTPPEVYRCGDYKIYHINDTINNYSLIPNYSSRIFLDRLGEYADWCICGDMGPFEYAQYMGNGGNLYIMLKDGFKNIPKMQGENCPLDEYGLSMIAVIVGTDGLPDNVTTRWNHDFGGENHSSLWEAIQIQKLTGVKYSSVFKPRSQEELRQMYLAEDTKKPSAMDQVHNKVNAGVMDAVTCGGMMEEGQGNLETWYRGYNSKYGSERTHLLWLTDDISYARAYGNRIEEVLIDMDKLNAASIYEMDGICGYEIDYYEGIDEEDAKKAMKEGVGGYEFEVSENEGYYCLCLWDKSSIVSRRELSKEEFENVDAIEGYDNPAYDAELNEMFCKGLLSENSNDRKVNKYISEKFGLTNFQDIRNKVMEIYEKIPYSRIGGGRYMLGVLRLLFEENLPREEYGVLNKILYKIGNSNYYERQWVNDNNLGGWSFEQLKERYFVPDFEGDKFSTAEKIVKLPNGYTVTRIDTYDEMNARCDGEWCISYDESMWNDLTNGETVYLVENEELINKFDEAMEDPNYSNKFDDIVYAAGEEDDMNEMGFLNSDLSWTNKPGSWKFPYDYYGLSRFVVLVGEKGWLTVYSRYNMPNEFDGDYLTKEQLEKLLGINFNDVFKYVPMDNSYGHYDNYGRWRVDAAPAVTEGAEPEADEYKIGGEGGNNEYFHAINESKIGNFDFKKYFKPIAEFMREDGLNVYPYPKIKLNWEPQDGLFIKTGYYEPETKTIVIFCDDRHPKDILRTFCHEMIHHSQNLDGVDLNFSSEDDVKDNERLEEIESEAYLKGNVYFRKWTEYAKKDSKDVLQEGRKKVVKNDKGEVVPEKCDKCGGDVVCQIHGEPVYICKECGKYFGTRPFNLKENKKKKEIFITEAQYRHLLSENEGTNMKRARKYLEAKGYSPEKRQEILDSLRTDIPNSRLQQCKFLLGVTRLYMEGQLRNGNSMSELNKALKYIASDAHANEYDYNLNGENLNTLVQRFSGVAKADLEQSKVASNARQLTVNNDYTIVPIDNPEEAAKYGKYTSWCVTHYSNMYNTYTANGIGRFYFCLRRGFENEPKIEGRGCPLDSYGLSMIAVSVTIEGEVNTITCRWNHSNGGNDNIMTIEQLENLLGRNFYHTFKPYTREELHAKGAILFDEVQGLLDSGKNPKEIFDDYAGKFHDGFAWVELNDKFNFINTQGKLLSNQWFDDVGNFYKGFARLALNGKRNFINTEGKLLSNQWFDSASDFQTGIARVELDNKYNLINTEGKFISNQWFDGADYFCGGFAVVVLNGKRNFINTEGKLLSNQWFDWAEVFYNGLAQVQLNKKWNFINTEGKFISNQWFDWADEFCEGFAMVKLNDKWYKIDTEGDLYDVHERFLANTSALNESFNVTKALQNLKKRRDPANIENWDTINEDTGPEDIDLSSFDIKTALNPKFWKDEHLDSRIRIRLLDIADDFIEFLGVNWVKPEDVIITGSLANYNWNKKYSDIDLHILMDFSKVDKRTDFVKDYFDSKKNLWNESHKGLSICGFPVELYVQDSNEKHSSTGVYSLNKNEWITEPNRASLKNSKINKALIKNKVSEFMDKIDKIDDIYKSADNDSYKARKASEMAEKLWVEIKAQRKEGLSDAKNEITNGNIIYKTLRRTGYLDKIFSLRDKSYDKVNSLDESQD